MAKPSVGVVIPTRNSASLLRRHMEHLRSWIDLAEEVVVVDSESTDSTLSILEAYLANDNVRILQHPPGLYPSWNFGIQQLKATWAYISTVGDTIERSHFVHLAESAEALACDVICSAPRFTRLESAIEDIGNSPARVICNELHLTGPALLSPGVTLGYALRFALVHGLNTPLGSSASNLYRTSCLQGFPFPAGYGSAGDAFWLLENATKIAYALTPAIGSTYLIHPVQHVPFNHDRKRDLNQCAAQIGFEQLAQLISGTDELLGLADVISKICRVGAKLGLAQHKLDSLKQSMLGRVYALGPEGWRARWKRKNLRDELYSLEASLVAHIADGKKSALLRST